MKEQLISFETAKLAKEKGFAWETEEFYTNPKKPYTTKGIEYMSDSYVRWWNWNSIPGNYPTKAEDVLCAAPTQSLLQKWLREKHNIDVTVHPSTEKDLYSTNSNSIKHYTSRIDNWKIEWSVHDGTGLVMPEHYHTKNFDKYEEALEKGLQEALKLILI